MEFVDTHLHLLPGLDDGPATMEGSLATAEAALADGTVAVVATPHSNYQWPYQPRRVAELRQALEEALGGRLRITTGCELHLSYENVQAALADFRVYSLNASRYLLVEFPEIFDGAAFGGVLEQLRQAGAVPVLAHPERNPVFQMKAELLQEYLAGGCIAQVTASSFTGRFGKRAQQCAAEFLDREWIHVVASDGHSAEQRSPRLSKAHQWIRERAGEGIADALCRQNPLAMLEDRDLPYLPEPVRRKKGLWARLRS